MIDIHSHILAGLDDGPESFEESLEMVRIAAASGTTDIVATPHANDEYRFEPETVEKKILELQAAAGDSPVIHYGCDFHLSPENIEDALRSPRKYSVNHRAYLLVEFSNLMIPQTTSEIFESLIASGLRPVITHPERNPLLRRRLVELESWVGRGCVVQITAQSLLGRFGKSARRSAVELLGTGLVHVLASDAHDLKYRPPLLREVYDHVVEHYGTQAADLLCIGNPRSILTGEPVEPVPVLAKTRHWYSPW